MLGIVAVAIAWYAPRYHEPARGTAVYLAAYNLALLACLAVLTAGGMLTFLVAWESMSLACYLVILRRPRSAEAARGAFWFLALSEIGFLLIVAAFVILSAKTHATQLDVMAARSHLVPGGWRAAAYLLALAGFGCKAGLVPLHVWLPEALPPLNGFVSEWLIFQGLFQGFRTGSHLIAILIVLAAATLGLTGGLAIYAFVRGFGIPYLGMPRTRQAAATREAGQPVAGPALLVVACVALAVGAPVMLAALSRAARTVTGVALGPLLLPGKLTVIPAHPDFSAFSPTYLAIFLVAACAVPALIFLAGRPRAASVSVPVWDGGMVSFRPRMQYSAMTFSAPTRVTFDALYRPAVSVRRASDDDPAGRSGPVHYEAQVTPVFERYLYQPVIRAVEWLADVIRPLQSGDVNLYLLYVFVMILLAYLLGAV